MEFSRKQIIAGSIALFLVTAACGISFDTGGDSPDAERTLQAIYLQDTVKALAAEVEQALPEDKTTVKAGFVEPEHKTVPGNPGSPAQIMDDIDTSKTADEK